MNDDRVYVEREGGGNAYAGPAVGFLVGLAVGAGLALLFAPQSGAETRRDISRRARRARRVAVHMAGDLREKAEDAYDTARKEFRRKASDIRAGAEEVMEEVKDRVDHARQSARSGARAAREDLQRRLADARDGAGDE